MIHNSKYKSACSETFPSNNSDPSLEAAEIISLWPVLPQMFYVHVSHCIISTPF